MTMIQTQIQQTQTDFATIATNGINITEGVSVTGMSSAAAPSTPAEKKTRKRREGGHQYYTEAAIENIREVCSISELYERLYHQAPTASEKTRLYNRFNPSRANPGADVLGLVIENMPELQDMTLAEFFGIR